MSFTRRFLVAILVAAVVLLLVSTASLTVPGMASAADEKIWILKFQYEHPKRIQMDDDTHDFKPYWYMFYTITNEDDSDHKFELAISATDASRGPGESDTGHIYHDGYYPRVVERLAKRKRLEVSQIRTQRDVSLALDWSDPVASSDPETAKPIYDDLDPETATPPRDVSKDPAWNGKNGNFASKLRVPRVLSMPSIKAKETWQCVAVFDRFDNEMDYLTIKIAGLTNDIISKSEKAHERTLTERVLTLKYYRPGDEFWTPEDMIEFVERKWIDVTRTIKSDLR